MDLRFSVARAKSRIDAVLMADSDSVEPRAGASSDNEEASFSVQEAPVSDCGTRQKVAKSDGQGLHGDTIVTDLHGMVSELLGRMQKMQEDLDYLYATDSEKDDARRQTQTCATDARRQTQNEPEDDASEFMVQLPEKSAEEIETEEPHDILDDLAAEIEQGEKEGPPVAEKLAKITCNRFTVKLPDQKLQEKMEKYPIPENCKDIRAPVLNEEIDKFNVNRYSKRNDGKLFAVQRIVSRATSALVAACDQLHASTMQIASAGSKPGNVDNSGTKMVTVTNQMLSASADVIALLGTAQQELSQRRRFQLENALPKDVASICSAKIEASDKLFGDNIDKLLRTAKESHRTAQATRTPRRFHPYARNSASFGSSRPFLGRGQRGFPRNRGRGRAAYRK